MSEAIKHSPSTFKQLKGKEPIVMLTAYNCPIARCVEQAGVSVILVGDSLAMVEMGFESTREVTVDQMAYHIGAVRRGAQNTHIIGDMPYGSDDVPATAVKNAKKLISAGADSVKLEGPKYEVVKALVREGIDVVGHTGLTPQTAINFKQVGKDEREAAQVLEVSQKLEESGCFMVVLEHIPAALGKQISESLNVPTVGIGAGSDCDGQVLVINDVIGMGDYWPPFSKQYAHVNETVKQAAKTYVEEVKGKRFP
jgi:3-methyl-2-oxobutanoate hydroxymethyltransferase